MDEARWQAFITKREAIESTQQALNTCCIQADGNAARYIETVLEKPLSREYLAKDLLCRPEMSYQLLVTAPDM